MGRYFLPEEGVAGNDHVAIITHKLWQGYFGRTLTSSANRFT